MRDVRYGNEGINKDIQATSHTQDSSHQTHDKLNNLHEEQQKEELAGGHHAAHEEPDGNAGVKSSHDHGPTDAQSGDNYGRPHGREGFPRRSGRYHPKGREGDEQGQGEDGVPFFVGVENRRRSECACEGVLLRCKEPHVLCCFFSAQKIRMISPERNKCIQAIESIIEWYLR